MVFLHAEVPLNVNLNSRGSPAGVKTESNQVEGDFSKILSNLVDCLTKDQVNDLSFTWSYEYTNLWTERLQFPGSGKRGRLIIYAKPEDAFQILLERTFWCKRLKKNTRDLLRSKMISGNLPLLQLKEILHAADGIMCSFLLGAPETLVGSSPFEVTDRINNGVISSLIHNYTQVIKDTKEIRKVLKKAMFQKTTCILDNTLSRRNSWWIPVIKLMNGMTNSNSKAKMFRVSVLTQTRATGLASKQMNESTIASFLEEVTVCREYKGRDNHELNLSITDTIEEIITNSGTASSKFKISMSTSACFESSKKKEGKFGYLRKQILEQGLDLPPPLAVGNSGGEIGTPMWNHALRMVSEDYDNMMKVNVAALRENGKSRVVTSGSFWKDTLLQPFSHLTIEMIKSNELLRDSMKAGRLGWKFIEGITHLDPKRGLPLFEKEVYAYSFDWTKATDRPTHAMGRALMGPLLKGTGLSSDIVDSILDVWAGEKELYVSEGGRKVHKGTLLNGIPMGDPLTKTCLQLAHPICRLYGLRMVQKNHPEVFMRENRNHFVVGAGNGDDGVYFSNGEMGLLFFKYFEEGASLLGYEKSDEDTFITDDWATYCEEVFRIPTDRFNTVINANRLKNSRLSPYLDVPKIRLILDTKKDRSDFSSDPQGKYTMLGKDCEYVRKDAPAEINYLFSVASAMQDICLGLKNRSEPVYLPRQVFGVGKAPPMWDTESWVNAILSQREWPGMVTVEAMNELNIGQRLLTAYRGSLKSDQNHFDKESYLEIKAIPRDDPVLRFRLVEKEQWKLFPANVLEKLIAGGKLVMESQITKYYLFSKRIEELSQELPQADLWEILKGLSIEIPRRNREEIREIVEEFKLKYDKSPWLLRYELTEDLYPYSIVEAFHQADPLRVDLEYGFLKRFVRKERPDSPYERNLEALWEWFESNFQQIINGEEYSLPPVDIIEDDPIILEEIARSVETGIIIVTNDRKLVNLADNRNAGKIIGRISVELWVDHDADESAFLNALRGVFPDIRWKIIVDMGALDTFLLKTDINPIAYPAFTESQDRTIRQQSDIYDVYLPPKPITSQNVLSLIKFRSSTMMALSRIRGGLPLNTSGSSPRYVDRRTREVRAGPPRDLSGHWR